MFVKTHEQDSPVHRLTLTSLCQNPALQQYNKAGLGRPARGWGREGGQGKAEWEAESGTVGGLGLGGSRARIPSLALLALHEPLRVAPVISLVHIQVALLGLLGCYSEGTIP